MHILTPDNALIFRITHVSNVAWLLANGVHCGTSDARDASYRSIGNPDLIARRGSRVVPIPPGGTLADYVPFYFTPLTPMLMNIRSGRGVAQVPMNEIAILVANLRNLASRRIPFVITDRHAYLRAAQFSNDLSGLERIDWLILQARDFARNPMDPGKLERYQAEALVHRCLPAHALDLIACYDSERAESLRADAARLGMNVPLDVHPRVVLLVR
jgi:hypothetical protein